jgi:hypothetical protein
MNRAIPCQSWPIVATAEVACHAGGRGFESRRSRRKHPANWHLSLPILTQSTAGFRTGQRAHPARASGRRPVSVKPCKSPCSVAGARGQSLRSSRADPARGSPFRLHVAGADPGPEVALSTKVVPSTKTQRETGALHLGDGSSLRRSVDRDRPSRVGGGSRLPSVVQGI